MEAYGAVHSKEAKEELDSQRDPISEMNTARLQDNDLRDLAEEVLEEVFKTSTVKEAEDIIFNMIPESNIVGREEKLDRIYAAFGETFSKIRLKNQAGQLEEFAKYRQKKRLEETWSARFNQDKRVARVHSTVIAEDVAVIKKGLLGLFEKKKGDPCWVGYKQVGMKNKGGKQVPNCVPASEAAQYEVEEGIRDMDPEKGTKERKAKLEKKRGMKMDDHPQYKEEFVVEKGMNPGFKAYLDKQKKKGGDDEGGDAPKGGDKPDFLDLDKDGDKKESMKKAAHDKKKGMKEELESSGKFSESEILKILASL
tara:strand:- start:1585 stop:2514 length:930 start_codon:yes stop_codon:yes gene_type:complete